MCFHSTHYQTMQLFSTIIWNTASSLSPPIPNLRGRCPPYHSHPRKTPKILNLQPLLNYHPPCHQNQLSLGHHHMHCWQCWHVGALLHLLHKKRGRFPPYHSHPCKTPKILNLQLLLNCHPPCHQNQQPSGHHCMHCRQCWHVRVLLHLLHKKCSPSTSSYITT